MIVQIPRSTARGTKEREVGGTVKEKKRFRKETTLSRRIWWIPRRGRTSNATTTNVDSREAIPSIKELFPRSSFTTRSFVGKHLFLQMVSNLCKNAKRTICIQMGNREGKNLCTPTAFAL
jgi:hypothetical protein